MMNNNLKNTKYKLTIFFTILVFFIILIFGTTFFTIKYFKEINFEKNNFGLLVNGVINGKISIEELSNKNSDFKNRFNSIKEKKEKQKQEKDIFSISYILYNNGNNEIISSDIKKYVDENNIFSIINNNKYNIILNKGDLLYSNIQLQNNLNLLIFQDIKYDLNDYLSDLFLFILFSLIFSIIVFIIGFTFVSKIFKPIEDNIVEMKSFIHNAGHELKTPLSVIDSNIQLMLDTNYLDIGMIKEIKNENKKINSLINGLINLSDIGKFNNLEKVSLSEILDEIIKKYQKEINHKKLNVLIDIKKDLIIEVNRSYFYILLSNIIGNSIKYNVLKGNINIIFDGNRLFIKDSGIGIDQKNLIKIFDRFYKEDLSRKSDGFGIGLSLVKKIADLYNLKIKVKSEKKKYTEFIIKF